MNLIKFFVKRIAVFIAYVYVVLYRYGKVPFKTVSIMISTWPGEFGIYMRGCFYRHTLSACGVNLRVHYGAYMVYPQSSVGNNCLIEEYSIISLCDIGDDVIIAARVSVMSGGHHHEIDNLQLKFNQSCLPLKKVKIGNNIWIGTHSVILNDISDGTVVAAGSVVTKQHIVNSVIAGVPAVFLRIRG